MSGILSQVGYASETVYGQAVVVDRFIPIVDESLTQDIERLESEGIIAGARLIHSEQWSPGGRSVTGDVGHEWFQQNMALLWEHALGTITSSFTAGIGTHTITIGDLTGKSFTTQVGKPTVTGTVIPHTYAGCKVASWTFAVETGEIATFAATLLAQTETTAEALAAASFITDAAAPYTYVQGAVTISGSSVCVRSLEMSGENNLSDERECIGQDFIDEPVEMDRRDVTGTVTMEYTSTAQYQRFLDGAEVPLVLSLSASASAQATVTANVRYDGVTPQVAGRDLVVTDIPVKVIGVDSDASGLTIVLINSQSEL